MMLMDSALGRGCRSRLERHEGYAAMLDQIGQMTVSNPNLYDTLQPFCEPRSRCVYMSSWARSDGMIPVPSNTRIWNAAGVTDMHSVRNLLLNASVSTLSVVFLTVKIQINVVDKDQQLRSREMNSRPYSSYIVSSMSTPRSPSLNHQLCQSRRVWQPWRASLVFSRSSRSGGQTARCSALLRLGCWKTYWCARHWCIARPHFCTAAGTQTSRSFHSACCRSDNLPATA